MSIPYGVERFRELKADRKEKRAYICAACKNADKAKDTHPGVQHFPGLCDCVCQDFRRR